MARGSVARMTVREQVIALGATPIQQAEGTWTAIDGSICFVSSRRGGPDVEDEEDVRASGRRGLGTDAAGPLHGGQRRLASSER